MCATFPHSQVAMLVFNKTASTPPQARDLETQGQDLSVNLHVGTIAPPPLHCDISKPIVLNSWWTVLIPKPANSSITLTPRKSPPCACRPAAPRVHSALRSHIPPPCDPAGTGERLSAHLSPPSPHRLDSGRLAGVARLCSGPNRRRGRGGRRDPDGHRPRWRQGGQLRGPGGRSPGPRPDPAPL